MNTAADMQLMINFCMAMLNGVADFLMQPPVFYLLSLIFFSVVCRIIGSLMFWRR